MTGVLGVLQVTGVLGVWRGDVLGVWRGDRTPTLQFRFQILNYFFTRRRRHRGMYYYFNLTLKI